MWPRLPLCLCWAFFFATCWNDCQLPFTTFTTLNATQTAYRRLPQNRDRKFSPLPVPNSGTVGISLNIVSAGDELINHKVVTTIMGTIGGLSFAKAMNYRLGYSRVYHTSTDRAPGENPQLSKCISCLRESHWIFAAIIIIGGRLNSVWGCWVFFSHKSGTEWWMAEINQK